MCHPNTVAKPKPNSNTIFSKNFHAFFIDEPYENFIANFFNAVRVRLGRRQSSFSLRKSRNQRQIQSDDLFIWSPL